jgi:hypothetical protein
MSRSPRYQTLSKKHDVELDVEEFQKCMTLRKGLNSLQDWSSTSRRLQKSYLQKRQNPFFPLIITFSLIIIHKSV